MTASVSRRPAIERGPLHSTSREVRCMVSMISSDMYSMYNRTFGTTISVKNGKNGRKLHPVVSLTLGRRLLLKSCRWACCRNTSRSRPCGISSCPPAPYVTRGTCPGSRRFSRRRAVAHTLEAHLPHHKQTRLSDVVVEYVDVYEVQRPVGRLRSFENGESGLVAVNKSCKLPQQQQSAAANHFCAAVKGPTTKHTIRASERLQETDDCYPLLRLGWP